MSTTATPEIDQKDEAAIKTRITEIQAELDEIGNTFGMQQQRLELQKEKDELLDALCSLFA